MENYHNNSAIASNPSISTAKPESDKKSGFGKFGKKIKNAFGNLSRKASPEPEESALSLTSSAPQTPSTKRKGSFSMAGMKLFSSSSQKLFSSSSQNVSRLSLNSDSGSPTKDLNHSSESQLPSGAQTPYSRSGSPDSIASFASTKSVLEKAATKIKRTLGIKQKLRKKEISNPLPTENPAASSQVNGNENAFMSHGSVDRWSELPDVSRESEILENAFIEPDIKRQEMLFKMFKSEILFLQELEFILKNLVFPMSQMSVSFVGFPSILQVFLENIIQIHKGHEMFFKTFERLYSQGSFINNSTDALITLLDMTHDAYIVFLSQFSETLETLDEFAEMAFESIPASSLVQGKRLLFSLSKRLQSYFDIAKSMIDVLPESFPDFDGIRIFKQKLDMLFNQVENRKIFLESRKNIEFILKHTNWSILPTTPNLLPPIPDNQDCFKSSSYNGTVVLNGEFIDIQFNSKRTERLKLVLFTDKLLFLRQNLAAGTELYRCLYPLVPISDVQVLDIADVSDAKNMFQLKCERQNIVHILQASVESVKKIWLEKVESLRAAHFHEIESRQKAAAAKLVAERPEIEIIDLESFVHSPRLLDLTKALIQEPGFMAKLAILVLNIRCKVLLRDARSGDYDAVGICRLSIQSAQDGSQKVQFVLKLESTGRLFVNCWVKQLEAGIQANSDRQIVILCPLVQSQDQEKKETLAIQFKNSEERNSIFQSINESKRGDIINLRDDLSVRQAQDSVIKGERDPDFQVNRLEHYDYSRVPDIGSHHFIPDECNLKDEKIIFQSWLNQIFRLDSDSREERREKWSSLGKGTISIYTAKSEQHQSSHQNSASTRICFQRHDNNTIPVNQKIVCYCTQLSIVSKRFVGLGLLVEEGNPRPQWISVLLADEKIAVKFSDLVASHGVPKISLQEFESGSYRVPQPAATKQYGYSNASSKSHQTALNPTMKSYQNRYNRTNGNGSGSTYTHYNNQNYSSYNNRRNYHNNQINNPAPANAAKAGNKKRNTQAPNNNNNSSSKLNKKSLVEGGNGSNSSLPPQDNANAQQPELAAAPAALNKLYNLSADTKKSSKSFSRDSMGSSSGSSSSSSAMSDSAMKPHRTPSDPIIIPNPLASSSSSSASSSAHLNPPPGFPSKGNFRIISGSISNIFQNLEIRNDTDNESFVSCTEEPLQDDEFYDCADGL